MNSYNHQHAKPRFRAVLFVDGPLTPKTYQLLFDNVVRKLEDAGYHVARPGKKKASVSPAPVRESGLDLSKRTAASLFHLPSQAADPSQSFFLDYNGAGREVLNPFHWIENTVVPLVPLIAEPPTLPERGPAGINKALMQAATDEWHGSSANPGEGNARFFKFALALRRARLTDHEIQSRLLTEAALGRTPEERRAQVKSIMASLRKPSRRAG